MSRGCIHLLRQLFSTFWAPLVRIFVWEKKIFCIGCQKSLTSPTPLSSDVINGCSLRVKKMFN